MNIGKIIGVVILVIIGLLMLPLVQDAADTAAGTANVTGTSDTLLGMIPLFYILGIVLATVLWIVAETRGFGHA